MSELSSDQRGITPETIEPVAEPDPVEFLRLVGLPHGFSEPRSPEDREFIRKWRERMTIDEIRLRRGLPHSTGQVEHIRMTLNLPRHLRQLDREFLD